MQYSTESPKEKIDQMIEQFVCIKANDDYTNILLMAKQYSIAYKVHVYINADSIGKKISYEQIAMLTKNANVYVVAVNYSEEYSNKDVVFRVKMGQILSEESVTDTEYVINIDMGATTSKYLRQAICIRAYEDFPLLMLMSKIYKDYFKVYVLIDKDCIGKNFTKEQIDELKKIPNVYVYDKYRMPKNSYNEVLALLEVFEEAFSDKRIKYIHMVTDMDMPIRPMNKLYSYYEQYTDGRCFLNCHAAGDRDEMKNVASYTYRYYHYLYNDDENLEYVKQMVEDSFKIQKKLGVKRNGIGKFKEMYKGVFGGSISKDAYMYFQKYIEANPAYLEDIKYTRLRTEFLFHTVLFNSEKFINRANISARGSKIDWDWDNKNKDYRKLDKTSYNRLKDNPENFFLRKVTSDNKEVINMILKDLKTSYKI